MQPFLVNSYRMAPVGLLEILGPSWATAWLSQEVSAARLVRLRRVRKGLIAQVG